MLAAIKAEFRKLFTVRSTYVLLALGTAFTIFYAFFIVGWQLKGPQLQDPNLLTNDVVGALTSLPLVFSGIVAILLMTHEYRYNTIMHTLTSSNSRTKVLASKLIAVLTLGLLFTAFIGVLSPLMSYWGVTAHGHTLVHQAFDVPGMIWRGLFEGTAYTLFAFILAALSRNQVAAIVSIFAIPIAEQVFGLLLKSKTIYLPFSALSAVLTKPQMADRGSLSFGHAAMVVGAYLVVGWLATWVLFLRRDAN
jgi:ABC-2 type transport system permease protein